LDLKEDVRDWQKLLGEGLHYCCTLPTVLGLINQEIYMENKIKEIRNYIEVLIENFKEKNDLEGRRTG